MPERPQKHDPEFFPSTTRYESLERYMRLHLVHRQDDDIEWAYEPEPDPTRPSDEELIPKVDR